MSLETLRGYVLAADLDGLAAWLGGLSAAERKALEPAVTRAFRERDQADGPGHPTLTRAQVQAVWLAGFALGASFAARELWVAPEAERVAALCPALRPAGVDAFVARALPRWWGFVAPLVEGGHAARPPERLWALGMLGMADTMRFPDRDTQVERWSSVFLRDLRFFFLHEGEGEFSLSAFSGHRWRERFVRWSAEGRLDRQLVLDLALDALASGWAPGRQPALTQMFDAFEPTPDEVDAREGALARLLHNAAPATVAWALGRLARAGEDGRVPVAALGAAALCRTAGTARAALAALERLAAARPELREPAIDAVAGALQHPDAKVQARALAALAGLGADPGRAAAPHLDGLAASVRAQLGVRAPEPPEPASSAPRPRPGPLDPSRALPAFDGDDHALVDALVPVAADASDVDLAERLFAAMATRPRPTDPAVLAHARAARAGWRRALQGRDGPGPGACVALVALAWGCGEPPEPLGRAAWDGWALHAARSAALARAVLAGPVAWMSLPTHRMGHLDPRVLVARWAGRGERPVLDEDLALALLRVERAPGAGVAPPPDGDPRTAVLGWALGGDPPGAGADPRLLVVAAHARSPSDPDPRLLDLVPALARGAWRVSLPRPAFLTREGHGGSVVRLFGTERPPSQPTGSWWDPDGDPAARRQQAEVLAWMPRLDAALDSAPGAAAWARAHWAGHPDHYPAVALEAVVGQFGGAETDTRQPSALAALFEDVRPLGPVGAVLLAAGLCSGHASVRVAAVDLFVACVDDGRLEVGAVADALVDFLREGFYPAGRLARALADCASAGPAAHDAALGVGLAVLRPALAGARELGKVIRAVHELHLARPQEVPPPARALLARRPKAERGLLGDRRP